MRRPNSSPSLQDTFLALVLSLTLLVTKSNALSQSLCSSQNTGTDHAKGEWDFQSNGYCHDQCDGYAFAIVQYQNCWCSNYVPSSTTNLSSCNVQCPGYPEEDCGNADSGLYGYVALDASPSGTAGAATSTKAATSTAPTSQTTTSTDTKKTSTWTPTPVTSIQVITVSGAPVTQTVTNTPTTPPDALTQTEKKSSSAGVIAGAVVGSVAGVALIVTALFFFLRRRQNADNAGGLPGPATGSGMQRNTSVLSKMGLLDKGSQNSGGSSGNRSSTIMNDSSGVSPISERRTSQPLVFDQRLNPNALMHNDNGSRASVMTMQDNRDYNRTLAVVNPDPRRSFTDE